MKISIITVCRNSAGTIADAIESVAAQRIRENDCSGRSIGEMLEIEHIVVDGGSADGTVEIIKQFASRLSAIDRSNKPNNRSMTFRWISEKDNGLYDGMNKGIRMATGEVVGILNADDMMAADDVLLNVAERFEKRPELEFLYSDVRFVDEAATLAKLHETDTRRYICPIIWQPWMLTFGYAPPHPGMYIRRNCFEKWGYYKYEYRIGADYEMTVRFTRKHEAKRAYMRKCTVAMRFGGSSTEKGNIGSFVGNNYDVINANRENGYWGNRVLILGKLPMKVLELIVPKFNKRIGA